MAIKGMSLYASDLTVYMYVESSSSSADIMGVRTLKPHIFATLLRHRKRFVFSPVANVLNKSTCLPLVWKRYTRQRAPRRTALLSTNKQWYFSSENIFSSTSSLVRLNAFQFRFWKKFQFFDFWFQNSFQSIFLRKQKLFVLFTILVLEIIFVRLLV